ncbi:MAG: hypothetical protein KC449_12025 [Anaerolineales bacterium]|nr:hypothetical protein [Anaerolineales bacterium]
MQALSAPVLPAWHLAQQQAKRYRRFTIKDEGYGEGKVTSSKMWWMTGNCRANGRTTSKQRSVKKQEAA